MKLTVKEEVKEALKRGQPVLALESTIISHGMPYPQNYQTALNVEEIVRKKGVIPATIAIIKGEIKIGLTAEEIDFLAKTGRNVTKVSRRDISYVVAKGGNGATTVAATMILAHQAGIKVFATGGIGGVHRNGENTMDISADLEELSQTPVLVVCSGVKSILDIPKTREYLETKGVAVCGYKTDMFPAFYTDDSGMAVDYNVDEETVAQMFLINEQLNLNCGIVVGVPVPQQYQMEKSVIDDAISAALQKAEQQKVSGKEITPFLLAEVAELTAGHSLDTNIRLICNNACVGSEIALKLSRNKKD